jgi:predicted anti-sigma-YlaC factor YlaD
MSDDTRRLAERLVGPADPELSCEECFAVLDSYVELELTGAAADAAVPRMRAHLQGCPACRGDHDSLLALLENDAEDAR